MGAVLVVAIIITIITEAGDTDTDLGSVLFIATACADHNPQCSPSSWEPPATEFIPTPPIQGTVDTMAAGTMVADADIAA